MKNKKGPVAQDGSEQEKSDSADNGEKQFTKLEVYRRNRAVRASKVLFRTIDVLFRISQNACPYVNSKNERNIKCKNDVVYDKTADKICKLDVYSVGEDENKPAVLLIHGGGFSAGDKKYRKGLSQFFALNGFKVFCVNYGLAPEHVFPIPLTHLVNAANFIYDNANKYGIDKDKILVAGDSAGAYYSAMLASFNCTDILDGVAGVRPKFRFFGAILNCGIYDMDVALNNKLILNLDDGVVLSFIGKTRAEIEDYRYKKYCMPMEFVNADFPPTFLIYSSHDVFCKDHGPAMRKKLEECGVYCEYYSARSSRSNHCFSLGWRGADASAANELMISFAKRLASDKIKL